MNIQEVEQYLLDEKFRYSHVAFKISTDGKPTVFLIWGGIPSADWVLELRAKLAEADIRLVVCDWDVFKSLYANLTDWITASKPA